MAEYIERAELMKFPIRIDHYDKEHGNVNFVYGVETVLEYAENIPGADVAPVVHGHWLKTEEPLGWHEVECIECSACHENWIADEDYGLDFADFWKYCPNCGARMDGE